LNKTQSEKAALWTGQFCALWLLRVIPFVRLETVPHHEASPEPSIWVCNHTSMLDVFMLLAADKKLRGKKKRPIKIVYVSQIL
jgi:1-acyl-sn-glycerol-3-phosphate acyltransferase